MKQRQSMLALCAVLAIGIGAGWLIVGVEGRPGDVATGFLLGVVSMLLLVVVVGGVAKGGNRDV